MKRVLALLSAMFFALAAFAQTAEEIVSKMEAEMAGHENDGIAMTVDLKMFILGTVSSRTLSFGDKLRMETEMLGEKVVMYHDGTTVWTYSSKEGNIEITNASAEKSDKQGGDKELFKGVTEGYDISIRKDLPDAWYILCRKSRNNKKKDDPKSMDLYVYKDTFLPKSMSASLSGVTMTMRDISFGITEDQVTFNPAEFPGVPIVDKR